MDSSRKAKPAHEEEKKREEQLKREKEKKIRSLAKNTRRIRCTYCNRELTVSCASSASYIQHQAKCYPLYKDTYQRLREQAFSMYLFLFINSVPSKMHREFDFVWLFYPSEIVP